MPINTPDTSNQSMFKRACTLFREVMQSPISHGITLGNTYGILLYGLNNFRNNSLYDSFIGKPGSAAVNFGTTLAITLGVVIASHQYTVRNRPLAQPDLLDQISAVANSLDTYNPNFTHDTRTTERTFIVDSSDEDLEEINSWIKELEEDDYDDLEIEFTVRRVEDAPNDEEANIGIRTERGHSM